MGAQGRALAVLRRRSAPPNMVGLEFLVQNRVLASGFGVLVVAAIGVWQLPSFVAKYSVSLDNASLDTRKLPVNREVETAPGVSVVAPSKKEAPLPGYLPGGSEEQLPSRISQPIGTQVLGSPPSEYPGGPAAVRSVDRNRAVQYSPAPVGLVDTPRPRYTDEARKLKIEGGVVLDVIFLANGKVQVTQVIRGLGHGLDETAVEAAEAMKFVPARTAGKSVDFPARLRIEFRLSN